MLSPGIEEPTIIKREKNIIKKFLIFIFFNNSSNL